LRFSGTRFWVTHRRREYGPFDYEWSKDFCGIELVYRGKKFGEYVSAEEIFADLKEFALPTTVVEVSSIVLGCVIYGVLNGLNEAERNQLLIDRLKAAGHEKFSEIEFDKSGG
jgi:hypothetical protein